MEYTPEEKSALIKDLHLLQRYKLNQEECEPFLKFSAQGCRAELLPDANSRKTNRNAIKAILKDLVSEGHPLLAKPKGNYEYWLKLGTEDAPERVDTVRGVEIPDSDVPEGFLEFEEKSKEILKRNFTRKKLLDQYRAVAPIFQSS